MLELLGMAKLKAIVSQIILDPCVKREIDNAIFELEQEFYVVQNLAENQHTTETDLLEHDICKTLSQVQNAEEIILLACNDMAWYKGMLDQTCMSLEANAKQIANKEMHIRRMSHDIREQVKINDELYSQLGRARTLNEKLERDVIVDV